MKTCLVVPMMLLALGTMAMAQTPEPAAPSASNFGFTLPSVEGTMTYALSGSEGVHTGYGSVGDTTAVSGDLAYLSSSPNKPFSLVYSGGYLYSSGYGYLGSRTFQNLAASQVWVTKNWNFVVDDGVSYLPDAPTTGLSGIPGVGDIGVVPVQVGDQPTESILTNNATRVGNGLNGGATRRISAGLSVNGSASWHILRFSNNEGINSSTKTGSAGPTYRIDARSSASANVTYAYTTDTYLGQSYSFTSEGISLEYERQLTPFLSVTGAAGPQRTVGSGAAAAAFPSRTTVVGSAGLSYMRRTTNMTISYTRATNSGSGVLYGALTDRVLGSVQQRFTRDWQGALTASYARNTALGRIAGYGGTFDAIYGGGQISRRLGREWSTYFSYTAVTQKEANSGVTQTAFSGLEQTFAFGITYSPGPLHFGHF